MMSVVTAQLLGFVREWMLAHQVGSNASTDAYYAAFTLPNVVNYLIAGGALSVTFIPVFTKYLAEDREQEGWHVFSTVIVFMSLLLFVAVVIGEVFATQLVQIVAPGFPPEQREEVVFLTRLMLPAQFGLVLGSILGAVQYAKSRFLIPSIAPAVYNLSVVLGGFILAPRIGIRGFSVGVLVGSVVGNLLLQAYGAFRVGARFRPNFDVRHPGFRLFLKMSVPIMFALSLTTTDDWIIRWFGSYLQPASITWLTYAKTLMRVPIVAVGQAVGVAAFPVLSRLYSEGKIDEINRTFNSILKAQLLISVPLAVLTMAQAVPLVHLVFFHTRLHAADLQATASALALFAIGMSVWTSQALVSRSFYAMQNSWTPAGVGTVTTVLTLPLYAHLAHKYQFRGIAIASSCGVILYVLTLVLLLARKTRNRGLIAILPFFLKISSISGVTALICLHLTRWLSATMGLHTAREALLVLLLGTGTSLIVLVLLAKITKLRELDCLLRTVVVKRIGRGGAAVPPVTNSGAPDESR
jgi:putative peptidoglycan lipid II flippase